MKNKVAICIGEMRYWRLQRIFSILLILIYLYLLGIPMIDKIIIHISFTEIIIWIWILLIVWVIWKKQIFTKEIENKFTFNIPKYWYLIHRCNLLKIKQEVKKNFKYDLVLITRPDVLYDKSLLENLSHKLDELYVYSSEINLKEEFYGFGTMIPVTELHQQWIYFHHYINTLLWVMILMWYQWDIQLFHFIWNI